MSAIDKLIEISSDPFITKATNSKCLKLQKSEIHEDIARMLGFKNGFVAFESALVVFPETDVGNFPGLDSWNDMKGWRRWYRDCLPANGVCFSQDLFGVQFAAMGSAVMRFDPEVGEICHYADSIEGWARRILENYSEDTGWAVAHDWQIANGQLPANHRLLPKVPFVLGGDYVPENLTMIELRMAMEQWGQLYQQIQSVPDGQEFTIRGWLQ